MKYDFSGYATKNDLLCNDGRIIRRNAFADCDGQTVPLVWQHQHNDPVNVLGHALLENRSDGVYAYGYFNDTPQGQNAKTLVEHGDITSMSIYANKLNQKGADVLHGVIREVSLVLAGANPGARIDNLSFAHSDGTFSESEEDAIIYSGSYFDSSLSHSDEDDNMDEDLTVEDIWDGMSEKKKNVVYFLISQAIGEEDGELAQSAIYHSDDEETVGDVWDTFTDEEKDVAYALVGYAVENPDEGYDDDDEYDDEDENEDYDEEMSQSAMYYGGDVMKHNVFDGSAMDDSDIISHSEIMEIMDEAQRNGSLKDTFLEHGITDLGLLMPEYHELNDTPEFYGRPMGWVEEVWNATRKSPFARIKTTQANITADQARARGYVKGNQKIEEVFSLLQRTTDPQTVYKLQKLDRDDIVDITSLDVVAWLKTEMRMMLKEELSRAIMIGDGRSSLSTEKIKEDKIRPIYSDDELYTVHYEISDYASYTDPNDLSNALVDAALIARKEYRGSGSPVLYASNDVITSMLIARDKIGHRMYKTLQELADAMRVSKIVEIPVFENATREDAQHVTHDLLFMIVNLSDYTVGADKGGDVTLFDDFDINYNKYEYLIETRCSGALVKPKAAIAVEKPHAATNEGNNEGDDQGN